MEALFTIDLAVLGLVVGSFLNVVIARVPKNESIVRPRSHCPKCGHQLAWWENVPVVSYLMLRGRCHGCRAPISPRYAIVELLTGVLFLACLQRFGWTWELVLGLVLVCVLVPLIFIDAEHWILPFELTIPGLVAGVLLQLPRGQGALVAGLIGAAVAFVGFRVLEALGYLLMKKEALGAGDKYLFALIGAFLGWRALLGVLMLSTLQGALFGVLRIAVTGRAAPPLPPKPPELEKLPEAERPPAPEQPPEPLSLPEPGTVPPPGTSTEPPATTADQEEEEWEPTFTPDFLRADVSLPKRLLLIPWTIFLQPIPDDPPGTEDDEEPEWTPDYNNLPFGPWIGLAAIEVLLLSPFIAAHLGQGLGAAMLRTMFSS